MKTLHRAAYEVLTPEEYKEFCRIPKELFTRKGNALLKDWSGYEERVIIDSFTWETAPDIFGVVEIEEYWDNVDSRVRLGIEYA